MQRRLPDIQTTSEGIPPYQHEMAVEKRAISHFNIEINISIPLLLTVLPISLSHSPENKLERPHLYSEMHLSLRRLRRS